MGISTSAKKIDSIVLPLNGCSTILTGVTSNNSGSVNNEYNLKPSRSCLSSELRHYEYPFQKYELLMMNLSNTFLKCIGRNGSTNND